MAEVVAFIKAGVKFIATLGAQGSAIAAATVVAGSALVGKGLMNLFEIEMPQADTDGSRQRTVRGTTVARKLVYGQALVSGPITYIGVSGTDNEDLYQVIALAGHEVNDITDIHFDDVVIPDADINSGSSAGGAVGGTGIFKAQNSTTIVTINKHLGTATQAADSMMVGAFTDYTSAHQGKGVAYIAMKWKLNEDSQETWDKYSPNDVKALVQGKKIYDPRLDSTQTDIPGSGSHRLADSTTWEYSTNPSLCVADYLKDTDFGLGVSSSKIDWVAVANAADSCDATVSIPDGSGGSTTEKRFTCNGVIFGTDNHKNNISKILSSMNGTLTYVNGEYIIRAGVYEAPSVSLDDDDLTGAVSIKTSFERSDRFNTIKGIFIDPSQNHKNTEFPKVTITDAVNRDNGEVLEKEIQLPMTNSSYMAQRIANKLIQQSDNQKVITLPVNLSGLNVRVGDRVNVSLSDLSWTNQIFECVGWNFNEEGGVTLTLRQDDSGSYDDLAVSGYSTITATGDITPGFAGVPSPSGLTATAGLKNIELNWTNPAKIDRVREIIVYASANNQWSSSQEIGRTLGTQFIHDGSNGTDAISVGDQRYYWIRSVGNSTGLLSDRNPDSDTSTIQATCGQNASGQQLTTGAVLGLDLFDTDNTTVMGTTDVKNQVTVNIEDENNVILETELGNNFLTQTVGDVGLTVYTEVTDLGAQYSVKIDNNGRVAGFGLSSTLPTNTTDPAFSEFIVIADKFQIVDPAATSNAGIQPFTVTAQKIRMGTDVEISGDLVTLGTISSDRIDVSGVITAGSIITTGSTIANDIRIGSGESVFSADSNGIYLGNETFASAEFRVTPAGALTATSATITGTVTADTFTLSSGATLTDADDQISNTNNNAFFRFETTAGGDDVSAPDNTTFNSQFGRNPRTNDVLVVVNTASTPEVSTMYVYSGSAWVEKEEFFTGDILVDGTLTATKIKGDVTETYGLQYYGNNFSLSGSYQTILEFSIPQPSLSLTKRNFIALDLNFSASINSGAGSTDEVTFVSVLQRKSKAQSALNLGTVATASAVSNNVQTITITGDVTEQIGLIGRLDNTSDGSYRPGTIVGVWFDGTSTNVQLFAFSGAVFSASDTAFYSPDGFYTSGFWVTCSPNINSSLYVIEGGSVQYVTVPFNFYLSQSNTKTDLRIRSYYSSGVSVATIYFNYLKGSIGNMT